MRALLLDIDGTTLLGEEALPGARTLVRDLRDAGIPHRWVTNNTSRPRSAWLARLDAAGLDPRPEELYTAGDATLDLLRGWSPAPRVGLLATPEVEREWREAGLVLAEEDVDVVVLTYDTSLSYSKVARAIGWIRGGATFLATHPDVACPTREGPLPDVGAFLALFDAAGVERPRIVGKPEPTIATTALARLGVKPAEAAMVGDRLATDMEMARRAGLHAWLVLTGVTDRATAEALDPGTVRVFPSLVEVRAAVLG